MLETAAWYQNIRYLPPHKVPRTCCRSAHRTEGALSMLLPLWSTSTSLHPLLYTHCYPHSAHSATQATLSVNVHPARACIAPRPPLARFVSGRDAGRTWPRHAPIAAGAFQGSAQLRHNLGSRGARRSKPHRLCTGWWRRRLARPQPCMLCGALFAGPLL